MMTSYIICAFVFGFLLATVIFWIVTRQLQKDWQAEYRRLMGGIKEVRRRNAIESCFSRQDISNLLTQIFNGDNIWPRK